ncbi:MAG: hypothetical protein IJW45_02350 [Oscillospiraceae bacterium]|nr:hypothetical protein [Oscillospiraceae bacterium]
MSTLLPMALMYAIRNHEYSYGYTKDGKIYYEEYFPNALQSLYQGKSASLYLCDPQKTLPTKIPNEAISHQAVAILEERFISDAYDALLEQERLGALIIRRYHELPQRTLAWIRQAEADTIRKHGLLTKEGPMTDYYRTHYPESWSLVEAEALIK